MNNIAKLPRGVIDGEPDEAVVEKLRDLLAQAERGEIVGIAYTCARPNGDTANGWFGNSGKGHNLSTGLLILLHEYARAWIEE